MVKKMNTIFHVAKAVRKNCEKIQKELKNYFTSDLCGMCAIASFALKYALRMNGIKGQVVAGSFDSYSNHDWVTVNDIVTINHCWTIANGKIIDITATQFGDEDEYDPVYITDVNNPNYFKVKFCNRFDILRKDKWPVHQIPTSKIVGKILGKDLTSQLNLL